MCIAIVFECCIVNHPFLIPVPQWRRIYKVGCGKNGVPFVVYRVSCSRQPRFPGNEISSKMRNGIWIWKRTKYVIVSFLSTELLRKSGFDQCMYKYMKRFSACLDLFNLLSSLGIHSSASFN